MDEKTIILSATDAIKIKLYIRETLKIVSIMADLVADERIDTQIRQEYDQKLKRIDLDGK
jgi:hypothetical protein